MREFDLCGLLPRGVTLLEASAGTGKTFAVAALVARLVADGVPLAQLIIVTFTRMATGELRERVRDRLVTAELGLTRALAGVTPPEDDPVLALLADGPEAEVEARRRRLAGAVSGFDAATIATTHGFCQHVLAGLGVAGDVERDVTFVEDLSDLVEEVVDDLYVRRFHRVAWPPFDRAEALRIGRAAVANPLAHLEPVERRPGDEAQTWAMRRRLAEAVRKEVDERKRRSGVMTYDDLLTRLRDTLADEKYGAAACAKLRDQYRVALVDEFQDTDPIQWEIMRRAFGEGEATLILIGDPKQAVYSFRGADVYAYLSAADSAVTKATLATNWRSDQGLIDALDALFDGAQLGHEGIVHRPVRAAEPNREPRLVDAPATAPLRLRDREGSTTIWNTETGARIGVVRHPGAVYSANFSPDGRSLITTSADHTARIWTVPRGRLLHELRGHNAIVYDAMFSRNGRLVVTVGDSTRVWDAATGSPLSVLHMHAANINAVDVSRNGLIATASDDRTARVYSCRTCGSTKSLLALATRRVTRELTGAERRQFLGDDD
jgi:hypothetical protein